MTFDIRSTGEAHKGRGVFLTRDVKHGEVLMKESPPILALPKYLLTRQELEARAKSASLGASLAVDYAPPERRAPPIRVCANCLRFLGGVSEQLDIICDDMNWSRFTPEMLEAFKTFEKPLPSSCPCGDCGLEMCSICTNSSQKPGLREEWHSWLCPKKLISDIKSAAETSQEELAANGDKELSSEELDRVKALRAFWKAHFKTPNFKFLFAARLIILVLNALNNKASEGAAALKSTLEARSEAIGDFATTPYSNIIALQSRLEDPDNSTLVDRLKSPELTHFEKEEARKIFDDVLAGPLANLKAALEPTIKSRYGSERLGEIVDNLFSRESWDRILGIVHVNMVDIRTYSPLHHYFHDSVTQKPNEAHALYQFVLMMKERYGGIPYCDGAALFSIYSKANHACKFNAISMGNELEEMRSLDQFARVSFVSIDRTYKGEELTLPYINVAGKTRAARQRELWLKYGFLCQCPSCSCGNPECLAVTGEGRRNLCTRCKAVSYCSAACQKEHWASHKAKCKPAAPMKK